MLSRFVVGNSLKDARYTEILQKNHDFGRNTTFYNENGRFYECIMSIVNKLLPVNPLGVCLPEVTVRGDNTLETTPGITP